MAEDSENLRRGSLNIYDSSPAVDLPLLLQEVEVGKLISPKNFAAKLLEQNHQKYLDKTSTSSRR